MLGSWELVPKSHKLIRKIQYAEEAASVVHRWSVLKFLSPENPSAGSGRQLVLYRDERLNARETN